MQISMRLNPVIANARDDVALECRCPREIKNVSVILFLGGLLELDWHQLRGSPTDRRTHRERGLRVLEGRPAPGECGENEDCSEKKTGCLAPRVGSPTGVRSPQPPRHSPSGYPSLLPLRSPAAVWGDGVLVPCVAMVGSPPLLSLPCLKAGKRCLGRLPSGHTAGSKQPVCVYSNGSLGGRGFRAPARTELREDPRAYLPSCSPC